MTAPRLPSQCAAQTRAHNQFLRAGHLMTLPKTGTTLYGLNAPPPPKFSLLMTFSFQAAYEIKIGLGEMPFIKKIHDLCTPWKLHELPPELARAALTHTLHHIFEALPEELALQDLALNANPPKDSPFHIGCELRLNAKKTQFDLFTKPDFPFAELAQKLGLQPMAKKTWPPQLYANFRINLAASEIPAAEIATLAVGDVLFLSPCAQQNP